MSTRGAIVRMSGERDGKLEFAGRYHHWDSYPSGLGKTLFELYNGHFNRNLRLMLKVLLDDHPAGWSTINGADFSLPAGFHNPDYSKGEPAPTNPQCYCHGGRGEEGYEVNQENASGMGCEWIYGFNNNGGDPIMTVLSSYCDPASEFGGQKMIGFFGAGDQKAVWTVIDEVHLDGAEPDWELMYERAMGRAA